MEKTLCNLEWIVNGIESRDGDGVSTAEYSMKRSLMQLLKEVGCLKKWNWILLSSKGSEPYDWM